MRLCMTSGDSLRPQGCDGAVFCHSGANRRFDIYRHDVDGIDPWVGARGALRARSNPNL
jgi:hypothetical protein